MKQYLDFASGQGTDPQPERLSLVIDTSPSMDFDDFKPSRLAGAVQAAGALVDEKGNRCLSDMIGIVGFSESARVIHPMVNVRDGLESVKKALGELWTSDYTNITAGLRAAERLLRGRAGSLQFGFLQPLLQFFTEDPDDGSAVGDAQGSARLILLSDGCANSGAPPVPVARAIKRRGIEIDVVGIGGSPNARDFDEGQLKQIASVGPDGRPRYCFIEDTTQLIQKFQELANHIRPLA